MSDHYICHRCKCDISINRGMWLSNENILLCLDCYYKRYILREGRIKKAEEKYTPIKSRFEILDLRE